MKTLEAAVKVKEHFDKPDSWVQNDLNDGEGRYCLIGAMGHFVGSYADVYEDLWNEFHAAVQATSLVDWNDAPGRTIDDVRKAAQSVVTALVLKDSVE